MIYIFMTIYFSKITIGILDYVQKYYKNTWLTRNLFDNIIDMHVQEF